MNIIESIIGIARAKQYLQGPLQDAIFKDHPPMGMVKLSRGISRSRPGIIMAEAEGDKLYLVKERFEKKSRQAAIFSAGK
jgi:hypothetical protein